MKDLVTVDSETGKHENHGVIIKKRQVGSITVYVTHDVSNDFYWIVWNYGRLQKMGFVRSRREDCLDMFFALTFDELSKLRELADRKLSKS